MNTRCKRCQHAVSLLGRDIHMCINRTIIITLDAQVIASGKTIDQALGDERNWKIDSRDSGLLPDVPWSAR